MPCRVPRFVPVNITSSSSLPTPFRSRRAAFTFSVVVAVALNAAVLGVAAAVASARGANSQPMRSTSWVTVVDFAPRTAPQRIAEVVPAPGAAPLPAPPQAATATVPKILPPAPVTPARSEQAPTEEPPTRYYRYGEVDAPAAPDGDWNLDTSLLDTARLERIVFEVFVDATGKVVGCSVLEPETLDATTRLVLETRLGEARLQPAVRHGAAVASTRTIEVSVSSGEN